MGLDMYAWAVPAEFVGNKEVDYHHEVDRQDTREQIAYWRKFNHLHGWMERLYREKGGEQEFNCTTVRLNLADLERLEEECQDPDKFTSTQGFFFGSDELYEPDMESLETFIDQAKELVKSGKAVFYDSWW